MAYSDLNTPFYGEGRGKNRLLARFAPPPKADIVVPLVNHQKASTVPILKMMLSRF